MSAAAANGGTRKAVSTQYVARAIRELTNAGYPQADAAGAVAAALRTGRAGLGRHHIAYSSAQGAYTITELAPPPEPGGQSLNALSEGSDAVLARLAVLLTTITAADAWLDSAASPEYRTNPLAQRWHRLTKVCAEAGEVWEAVETATGGNPRKARTRDEKILEELADTAMAALLGIQHETKDVAITWSIFLAAAAKVHGRMLAAQPVSEEDSQ